MMDIIAAKGKLRKHMEEAHHINVIYWIKMNMMILMDLKNI